MNMSESVTKLAPALVKFNSKVNKISKDASNPFLKNKYATLDQIIDVIRPLLSEQGLTIMQNTSGTDGNITVKTFVLHESGEWIESEGITLKPQKNDPQGAGGAVTYGRRYDLCAFLSLNTGEDDDGNQASGQTGDQRDTPKPSGKPASDKQLTYIKNLLNEKFKSVQGKYTYDQLHDYLKKQLDTQNNMENFTSQEAKKAIDILQNKDKQGA